jgi:hypothetical protein
MYPESRILDLDFFPSGIPDPGVKKHRIPDQDPQASLERKCFFEEVYVFSHR